MVTTRIACNQVRDQELILSPMMVQAFEELSAVPDHLGVPFEQLPLSTTEAIDEIIPLSSTPRRVRRREERCYKPYVKTCGSNVLQSCLNLAIHPDNLALHITALQPELPFYETTEGRDFAALAIVAMKGIADLAKKVGMSYAQTQQIVLLLVTLGFMKRMRFGRRFIYAVPLVPYNPPPEIIHHRLEDLLRDLDLEERSSSHAAKEKRERFRRMVEMIKLRYEVRYGLYPDLSTELLIDPERVAALREIQAVLPPRARALAMPEITKIVVSRLVGKNCRSSIYQAQPSSFLDQSTVDDQEHVVDSLSLGQKSNSLYPSNAQYKKGDLLEQTSLPFDGDVPMIQVLEDEKIQKDMSRLFNQGDLNAENEVDEPLSLLEGSALVGDLVTSSFDGNAGLEKGEYRSTVDKVILAEQAEILALVLEEDWRVIVVEGEKQRVSWVDVTKDSKTVRMSCGDPEAKLMKVGCHRAVLNKTDPMIAKAAFVYTLWWGKLGKIKKVRPAFFKSICERWMSEHNWSYEEACKANTRSRGTSVIRGGVGVPRQVRKIMSLFGDCSYKDLALIIQRCTDEELKQLTDNGVPPTFAWSSSSLAAVEGTFSDRDEWLMSFQQLGKKQDQSVSGMSEQDAQALLKRITVETPSISHVGRRQGSDHTFSVCVSLRGASWEICSIEEWDCYQEKLSRIKQLKNKLKDQGASR